MSLPDLRGSELLHWLEETTTGWRKLLAEHPEALAFPCGIRETTDVAGLLQHIVAVELRYAERLHDLPESPYTSIPKDSVQAIFAVHDRAAGLFRELDAKDVAFWDAEIEFVTRSAGPMTGKRSKIFVHAATHSIRHYAQLATLMREHGLAAGWAMDFLFLRAAPAAA